MHPTAADRGAPCAVGDVLTAEVWLEGLRKGWIVVPVGSAAAARVAEHLYAPGVRNRIIEEFPGPPRKGYLYTWWHPMPRFLIPLERYRPRRKTISALRRTMWRMTVNRGFDAVLDNCARDRWPKWITPDYTSALREMLNRGHAYSSEVWDDGQLVGGGFGLILGKVVSIESHFFIRSPASKIAILSTCWRARAAGAQYIDLQWFTEHGYQAGGSETNVDLRLLAAEGTIVLSDREVDASEIVAAYGS